MLILAALLATDPPAVSLDQLRTDPDRYAGQVVRLSGQLNECWGWTCRLCPAEVTPSQPLRDRCLSIDFADGRLAEPLYRFADIAVQVVFDPTCLPRKRFDGEIVVCTDRASVLREARVERVGKRRTSREGLWTDRREELKALRAADDMAIRAALAESSSPESPGAAPRAMRSFTTASSSADNALVCRLGNTVADELQAWPATYEAALLAKSAVDRFECYRAIRRNGRWRILVN